MVIDHGNSEVGKIRYQLVVLMVVVMVVMVVVMVTSKIWYEEEDSKI